MILAALGACQQVNYVKQKASQYAEEAREAATTPALDCDSTYDQPTPDRCLSGTIKCGDTIEGTTEGGQSLWDDAFYSAKFCMPAGNRHHGAERVYRLDVPESQDVRIKLQSDCVDLDVVAVAWAYDGSCPTEAHIVNECEGDDHEGGGRIRINTFRARTYLVGVDGKDGATGPFRLSVACTDLKTQ